MTDGAGKVSLIFLVGTGTRESLPASSNESSGRVESGFLGCRSQRVLSRTYSFDVSLGALDAV